MKNNTYIENVCVSASDCPMTEAHAAVEALLTEVGAMIIHRLVTKNVAPLLVGFGISAGGLLASGTPLQAQPYPIDCAILLCLSGGWPSDPVCSAARAEFIRRATPYPVEPPLQIWNCPMQTSYSVPLRTLNIPAILEATFRSAHNRVLPSGIPQALSAREDPGWRELSLTVSQKADVDISSQEFDFVRSIRVYQIEAWQAMRGSDGGNCQSGDSSRLGTYGVQGDFSWSGAHLRQAPPAFGFPTDGACATYNIRAVFVDWRDYQGNYAYERIDY